jgi:hypothetical protein
MMKIRKGLTGEELKKSLTIEEIKAEAKTKVDPKLLDEVKLRLGTSGYGLTPSKSRIISKPIESTPAPPAITVSAGGSTAITTFRRVEDLTSDESKNGLLAEPPDSTVRVVDSTVRPADPVIVGHRLIGPKDEDLNLPEAEAKVIVYRKPRGPNKTAEEKNSKNQLEAKKFNERIAREREKERKQQIAKNKVEQKAIERQEKAEQKALEKERKQKEKEESKMGGGKVVEPRKTTMKTNKVVKGGVKFSNEV